jgi:acylphosphatase
MSAKGATVPTEHPEQVPADRVDNLVRVHVLVEGRVQRVAFRYNTRREAIRLGLSGWVRNLSDGRVEAVFEGPRAIVDEMLEWTRRGPNHARVTVLHMQGESPQGEKGFVIR